MKGVGFLLRRRLCITGRKSYRHGRATHTHTHIGNSNIILMLIFRSLLVSVGCVGSDGYLCLADGSYEIKKKKPSRHLLGVCVSLSADASRSVCLIYSCRYSNANALL